MNIEKYLARSSTRLSDHHTKENLDLTDKEAKRELKKIRKELAKIQDKMYAHDRYSVLLCFQGMDTAGKDSLIREVFKGFNARGVDVHSFKTPTDKELQHDYMWRHYFRLPEKGKFGVFNRSHYENVLIARVRPEIVLNEKLPGINTLKDLTENFWEERYKTFNDLESHLARNGVIILKFFLNLGKEEQKQRILRRLEKEEHNWKFSPSDIKERQLWDNYIESYEEMLQKTSKEYAPWYIVPADSKSKCRLIVAQIIRESLNKYDDICYPKLNEEIQSRLSAYKEQLKSE